MGAALRRVTTPEILSWLTERGGASIEVHGSDGRRDKLGWVNYSLSNLDGKRRREHWMRELAPLEPHDGEQRRVIAYRTTSGYRDANARRSNGEQRFTALWVAQDDVDELDDQDDATPSESATGQSPEPSPPRYERLNGHVRQRLSLRRESPTVAAPPPSLGAQHAALPAHMAMLTLPTGQTVLVPSSQILQMLAPPTPTQGPFSHGDANALIIQLLNMNHHQNNGVMLLMSNLIEGLATSNSHLVAVQMAAMTRGTDKEMTIDEALALATKHGPKLETAFKALANDKDSPEWVQKMSGGLAAATTLFNGLTAPAETDESTDGQLEGEE